MNGQGLLDGVRVLDLTRVLAGPYCGMMLADMGADVIKIEMPGKGDDARRNAPIVNGESAYYMNLNRNKRGMTLNLKSEEGKKIFRELVKDLAAVFRTRIELRQIGVRDETKIRGGIGICGRPLCCSTYLTEFAAVSIKMAKEQNLSLNPTKISGVCGRLMCCLTNEEETYEVLNSQLPSVGDTVTTNDGLTGVVQSLSVLRRLVKVVVNLENDEKEIREYKADDLKFRPRRKKQKVTKEEQKKLAALEKKEGASKLDDK